MRRQHGKHRSSVFDFGVWGICSMLGALGITGCGDQESGSGSHTDAGTQTQGQTGGSAGGDGTTGSTPTVPTTPSGGSTSPAGTAPPLNTSDIHIQIHDVDPTTSLRDEPVYHNILPGDLPTDTVMIPIGMMPISNGHGPPVSIDVPADVYSFMVMAYAHDGVDVIMEALQAPDGAMWISDVMPTGLNRGQIATGGAFGGAFFSPNRVLPSTTTGAFMVPNTPDLTFIPGTYRFRLGTYHVTTTNAGASAVPVNQPVYAVVLVRRAKAIPTQGRLDLTLHFTGAQNVTAATAPTHQGVQKALNLMRNAYGTAGIALGDIHYVDLPDPTLRTIVLGSESCSGGDLDRLLRSNNSADTTNNLNLFFVDRFQCMVFGGRYDMGQAIGGIAGGIPGMARAKGTTHSGVAVALSMLTNADDRALVVMAHETGHFLGLYHTMEGSSQFDHSATVYDNIKDTPDTARDAARNLMYFTAGTDTTLSPGQGVVMRRSPFVQP